MVVADASLWDGEYVVNSSGMRVVVKHKTDATGASYLIATSDAYLRAHGNVRQQRIVEMLDKHGMLSADGKKVFWSSNETWSKVNTAKDDAGRCPPLTCFSACDAAIAARLPAKLLDLLSDRKIGCVDFTPGVAPSIVKGPCAPAKPDCRPGYVVHDRRCVKKQEDHHVNGHHDWDMLGFRQRLVAAFVQQAWLVAPRVCRSPRIAIVGLWDYDRNRDNHFGNATSVREFSDVCVASMTWEVPLSIERFFGAAQAGSPTTVSSGRADDLSGAAPRCRWCFGGGDEAWSRRPIAIPDAYYLMTRAYQHASLYFSKAGINVTKAAIYQAGGQTPWEAKERSVVWRGTATSDVSRDRARLVDAAAKAVEKGAFSAGEVNIYFSEKFFQRDNTTNHSAHMEIAAMVRSRGIVSVDGIGNEWTLPWKLLSNSVTLLVESRRTWQWYYPQLLPWKHYVPIKNDLSDFEQRVSYVLDPANDAALRAISEASTALVARMDYNASAAELRQQLQQRFRCEV